MICLALICVSFAWTKLPPKKASLPGTGGSAAAAAAAGGAADAADAKLDGTGALKQESNGSGDGDAECGGAAGGGATLDVVEFTPITLAFR